MIYRAFYKETKYNPFSDELSCDETYNLLSESGRLTSGETKYTFGTWYATPDLAVRAEHSQRLKSIMSGESNFFMVMIAAVDESEYDYTVHINDETNTNFDLMLTESQETQSVLKVDCKLYKVSHVSKGSNVYYGYKYMTLNLFDNIDHIPNFASIQVLGDVIRYKDKHAIVYGSHHDLLSMTDVSYFDIKHNCWVNVNKKTFNNLCKTVHNTDTKYLMVREALCDNYVYNLRKIDDDTVIKNFMDRRRIFRLDLYQKSDNLATYDVKTFQPRVPGSVMLGECESECRVCFSATVEGCLSAVPWGHEVIGNSTLVWVSFYDDIGDGAVVYDLAHSVPDSPVTKECWLTEAVTVKSRLAIIDRVSTSDICYDVINRFNDITEDDLITNRVNSALHESKTVRRENGEPIQSVEEVNEALEKGETLIFRNHIKEFECISIRYITEEEILMSREKDYRRFKELNKEIEEHDLAYYVRSSPTISDKEYDELVKELESLVDKYPDLKSGSVLDGVSYGTTNTPFKKVKHEVPMLSLKNTYNGDEVGNFVKMVKGVLVDANAAGDSITNMLIEIQPKYDGISCELRYENGILRSALTRGDGEYGEDITHNVMACENISNSISLINENTNNGTFTIRGEMIIDRQGFERINDRMIEEGKEPYMNPRNLVSGVLRRDEANWITKTFVKFAVFDSLTENLDLMYTANLIGSYFIGAHKTCSFKLGESTENITTAIMKVVDDFRSMGHAYPIDGSVIKVHKSQRKYFQSTSRYPKWAIAYKYDDVAVCTTLKRVEVQVGRTGRITPVAIFDPIIIDGSKVSKATLHNYEEIERLGIKIRSTIEVVKAAAIIPKVVRVVGTNGYSTDIRVPSECPECGTHLIMNTLKDVYCPNVDCVGRVKRTLEHFVSRVAMDITGFGPMTISRLVNTKMLSSIPDIYRLPDKLVATDKVSAKLIHAIDSSKSKPYYKVLIGLGIPDCGVTYLTQLGKKYKTIDELYKANDDGVFDTHKVVDKSLKGWLNTNTELVNELKDLGLMKSVELEESKSIDLFDGESFCITGKDDRVTRDELGKFIESHGGVISKTITNSTVLYGDKAGSKLDKAKSSGRKLISINDFIFEHNNDMRKFFKRDI